LIEKGTWVSNGGISQGNRGCKSHIRLWMVNELLDGWDESLVIGEVDNLSILADD
jgi:hypothetical protein